jgi:ATP-dependent protease HslVU (ClpYQ) peptidase subunit
MTTIVAIQGEGYSVICTDSRISSFDETGMAYQITTLVTGSSKIAPNGKYLLGSAGDGRARAERIPQIGSVIGKALEDFIGDHGVIEVVVGRV